VAWSGVNEATLLNVHLAHVTIPTVLIASSGDRAIPTALVRRAYESVSSADKALFEMNNAAHVSITSGFCPAVQSAGAIVLANPRAFLEARLLRNRFTPGLDGPVQDFCEYSDFTVPTDITSLVKRFEEFEITPLSVPRTLSAGDVVRVANELTVSFLNVVLKGCGHFSNGGYLNPEFMLKKEPNAVLAAEATYQASNQQNSNGCADLDEND
jgi:hypothetical protein